MQHNEQIIHTFYTAFSKKDFKTMQASYHRDAIFNDSAFSHLTSAEVKAMWEMLLTSATDLRIEYSSVKTSGDGGSAHWEAWYTFSTTGRKVHNIIDAKFEFREGKIYRHNDSFSFWRWSRQSLGLPGLLLGWSPMLQNKVRKTAKQRLQKFMGKKKN